MRKTGARKKRGSPEADVTLKQVMVSLERGLYQQLLAMAATDERSVPGEIRWLIGAEAQRRKG